MINISQLYSGLGHPDIHGSDRFVLVYMYFVSLFSFDRNSFAQSL